MSEVVIFIGGIRSGKSAAAVRFATEQDAPVTFVATGEASDPEMEDRIERHRRERPDAWHTVETGDAERALLEVPAEHVVLIDGLGMWVARLLDLSAADAGERIDSLLRAVEKRRSHWASAPILVVTDEVGLSLVPVNDTGRRFTDLLGEANQRLCAVADTVRFYVAGRSIEL